MDEIRLYTVGDLGEGHVVFAFCTVCRRDSQLNIRRLVAVYGMSLTVAELRDRLTCSRCGNRSRDIRIVYSLPAR